MIINAKQGCYAALRSAFLSRIIKFAHSERRRHILSMYLIANIIVCVCALTGFIYGVIKFFRPRQALYAQMITLSLGCITFGRLFNIVRLMTGGDLTSGFQLGFLGMVGSLMFFFSANYGTVDSLLDDRTKAFRKYRLIAFAAPAAVMIVYVLLFLLGDSSLLWIILGAVLSLFALPASYFNLKHLIFPDVDFGVVKCLRPYNLLALIYTAVIIIECFAMSRDNEILTLVCCCITALIAVTVIPLIVRGIKKWRT